MKNTSLSVFAYLTFFLLYTRHATHLPGIMRWLVGWTLQGFCTDLQNSTLETILEIDRGLEFLAMEWFQDCIYRADSLL